MLRGTISPKMAKGLFVCITIILTFSAGVKYLALATTISNTTNYASQAQKTYQEAIELARAGHYDDALPLFERAMKQDPTDIHIKADYILCLVWKGSYKKATLFYSKFEKDLRPVSYLPRNIAKAFYDVGDYTKSKELYLLAMKYNKNDTEAFKGLIYSLCRLEEYDKANNFILGKKGVFDEVSLLYLQAHVFKNQGRCLEAYYLYSKLLKREVVQSRLLKEIQDGRRETITCLKEEGLFSLLKQLKHVSEKSPEAKMVYIVALIDGKHYAEAIEEFEVSGINPDKAPYIFLLEIAWAYFKEKDYEISIDLYENILKRLPELPQAQIGLAYNLGAIGEFEEAHALVNKALQQKAVYIDALFAQAFIFEKEGKFLDAIKAYDQILSLHPNNRMAPKLKIRALSDLGARTYAIDLFRRLDIEDEYFMETLIGDTAVDRIEWKEPDEAMKILKEQLQLNPDNFRARCDYILALREKEDMLEIIHQFKIIEKSEKPIPYWITRAVADAYLYLEKPYEALKFYKVTLEKKPDDFKATMGLFYTYQEIRDWDNGEKTWQKIKGWFNRPDIDKWDRLEAIGARGWYLGYGDRLAEVQAYFKSYLDKAGSNAGLRAGLGHVYLWRGWPRLAWEELKIAHTLDPKHIDAQNGIVMALNDLNYKKEARKLADELYKKYYKNKHFQDVYKNLKVEDMRELWTDFAFIVEDPGDSEYWFTAKLTEPLTPLVSIYQETHWKWATFQEEEVYWRRIGLGSKWIVHPELIWDQAVSFDYIEGGDFGYRSEFQWFPNDHLKMTLLYDSYSLDIPFHARVTGVEAQTGKIGLLYHESDLRHMGLWATVNWYDDDNTNYYWQALFNQNLINTPDFKIRCQIDVWYGGNEKTDVAYFSPHREFNPSVTAILQWVHYMMYEKAFKSNVYLTIGPYKQTGYDYYPTGGVTYEQLIDLSKKTALVWNVSWHRRVYDGVQTEVWSGYVGLRKNF